MRPAVVDRLAIILGAVLFIGSAWAYDLRLALAIVGALLIAGAVWRKA